MSSPRRILLSIVLGLAVAACASDGEDRAAVDGLLVLSGEVGRTTLEVYDATAESRVVSLPDPATAWVAAGRGNVLLATMLDGRTYVSAPLGDGDPSWRQVEPRVPPREEPPDGPLYFGTWDPAGGVYAMLAADLASGSEVRVVVVDPSLADGASEVAIAATPAPAAPAWIDGDRLIVLVGGESGRDAVVLDTPTGDVTAGPPGVRLAATSADGRIVATWRGSDAPVEVQPTEDWLAGGSSTIRIDPPDGATTPAVLALDRTGTRLAIVWTDATGSPFHVAVHAGSSDWRPVATIDLDGATVASAAWTR